MSQSTTIMAFRKRAKNLGYTDISIRYVGSDSGGMLYQVSAKEPMDGAEVCFKTYGWSLTFRLRKFKKNKKNSDATESEVL